jgi:HEAT repeat protein
LTEALDNPDPRVRRSAAEALVGQPASEASAQLLSLLEADPDPLVRRAAAVVLGHLDDPSSRDVLAEVIQDPNTHPLVREAAEQAYQSLPDTDEPAEISEDSPVGDPNSA